MVHFFFTYIRWIYLHHTTCCIHHLKVSNPMNSIRGIPGDCISVQTDLIHPSPSSPKITPNLTGSMCHLHNQCSEHLTTKILPMRFFFFWILQWACQKWFLCQIELYTTRQLALHCRSLSKLFHVEATRLYRILHIALHSWRSIIKAHNVLPFHTSAFEGHIQTLYWHSRSGTN